MKLLLNLRLKLKLGSIFKSEIPVIRVEIEIKIEVEFKITSLIKIRVKISNNIGIYHCDYYY